MREQWSAVNFGNLATLIANWITSIKYDEKSVETCNSRGKKRDTCERKYKCCLIHLKTCECDTNAIPLDIV
jgi:hypothetical protein